MKITRRHVLTGLIAAPAIVSASNIMPVKALAIFATPKPMRLADYLYDGFWFIDGRGRKFGISPVGILTIKPNGECTSRSASYLFEVTGKIGDDGPRLMLNDADHNAYFDHLKAKLSRPWNYGERAIARPWREVMDSANGQSIIREG